MEEKKNPDALRDHEDGLNGIDHQSMFGDRSKENKKGLKKKAQMDEADKKKEDKREKVEEDDDDDFEDDDD